MTTSEELKQIVKEKYSEIAEQSKGQNETSCCGSGCGCSTIDEAIMAEDYSKLSGYTADADLGLGCGLPTEYAKIKAGDSVLTSNLSGSYPPGIMIGTVAALEGDPGSGFYDLKVKTSTDFYSLQYAYLVNNMIWIEQKELEAKTPKESK